MSVLLISWTTVLIALSETVLITVLFIVVSMSEFKSDAMGREDIIAGGKVGTRPLVFGGAGFDDNCVVLSDLISTSTDLLSRPMTA